MNRFLHLKLFTYSVTALAMVLAIAVPAEQSSAVEAYQSRELPLDGQTVRGRLTTSDPYSVFMLTVPDRRVVLLETSAILGAPLLDTLLYLFEMSDLNTPLEVDDDDGVGRFSRIERELEAGQYLVAVAGYNSALGSYAIQARTGQRLPTATPTRVPATPTPTPTQTPVPDDDSTLLLVDAGPVVFEFSEPNAQDLFRFVPPATGSYTIETTPDPFGASIDTVMALYGPDDPTELIATNDDADGFYSRIEGQLNGGRTYYVSLREYYGNTGSYQLEVRSDGGSVVTPTQTPTPTPTPSMRPTLTPTIAVTATPLPPDAAPVIRVEPNELTFAVSGQGEVSETNLARSAPTPEDMPILLKTGDLGAGEPTGSQPRISPQAERVTEDYVLLQFHTVPTAEERYELARQGIHLLQYVPHHAYWARIDEGATPLGRVPMGGGIRWAEASARIDKLEPAVREGDVPEYARISADQVGLLVSVLPGVDRKEAERALETDDTMVLRWKDVQSVEVSAPLHDADRIAALGLVEWVDFISPPVAGANQTGARILNVLPVYDAPYNLSGKDIRVGVWDAGSIYEHRDFGNRLTIRETFPRVRGDEHATHVGGSVGGAGTINSRARGMAPRALIDSYDWNDDTSEMRIAGRRYDTRLSNHSYGYVIGWAWDPSKNAYEDVGNTRLFGSYTADSRDWDSVVQQQGLIIFKAAGNDRCEGPDSFRCSGDVDGPYDIIGPQAGSKNVITVGATDDQNNMSDFSCWGPTNDGRIKPDISSNGVSVYSTLPGNSYGSFNGTSMASPIACGIGTLLYELFSEETGEGPDAAMIKALLIHAARDRGNPGPDYSYGFGVIDAKASCDLILGNRYRTGKLDDGETRTYRVVVEPGQSSLKTTLVWTDAPGSPSSRVALVNNLDLRLISPSGTIWLPWVLDGNRPDQNATRGVNEVDNVEQVEVPNPEAGTWTIEVRPTRIAQGEGDFVLISDSLGNQSSTESNAFRIFNDGNAPLRINAMSVASAPWISLNPEAPLVIAPGQSAKVDVSIRQEQVPEGTTERRVQVFSNDEDQSPYPDGVVIRTSRGAGVVPTPTAIPRPTPTPVPPTDSVVPTDGTPVNDRISQIGERDRFHITPSFSGVYFIQTLPVPNQPSMDTVLRLYGPDSDTDLLVMNDDGGRGLYSLIRIQLEAGRHYVAEVMAYNDESTGSYAIQVESAEAQPEPTPRPPIEYPVLQVNALALEADINPQYDIDWYTFTAPSDGTYIFETAEVRGGRITDTVLQLYQGPDTSSPLLAENDDISSVNRSSRVTLEMNASDQVFVLVRGYSTVTGPYTIRVRR